MVDHREVDRIRNDKSASRPTPRLPQGACFARAAWRRWFSWRPRQPARSMRALYRLVVSLVPGRDRHPSGSRGPASPCCGGRVVGPLLAFSAEGTKYHNIFLDLRDEMECCSLR